MAESIVTDWLTDFASLEPTEIRAFAAQHEENHEISSALFTIISERIKYPDVSCWPDKIPLRFDIHHAFR